MNCRVCDHGLFHVEQLNSLHRGTCERCFGLAANRLFELFEAGRSYVKPWGKEVRVEKPKPPAPIVIPKTAAQAAYEQLTAADRRYA